jgi:hypothetical protein
MSHAFEVQLTQLTPLIHFQHDQHGATLRATEFKPKFDRFLIDRGVKAKKLANGGESVEYKLSIVPIGETNKNLPNSFLYFANNPIKDDSEKRRAVKSQKVKLNFFSFNQPVLDGVQKHLCEFLAVTNFGTRQSKGYGGFYPEKAATPFETALKQRDDLVVYWTNSDASKWQKDIDAIHKELKAGVNFQGYKKSLLFLYMKEKHAITWEKRAIKEKWRDLAEGKRPSEPVDPKSYRYVRALLGLAEHNEYRGKRLVKIRHKNDAIDRFRSPITYKFYGGKIYLLCDRSYEKLRGEEFIFDYGGSELALKVPEAFDIADFMRFVASESKLGLRLLGGAK